MMIALIMFLAFAQVSSYSTPQLGIQQSVQVQGKLICNGSAYFDARVVLFNNQLVPIQLAETKPNSSGDFSIAWSGSNLVQITPIVNIYHRCHYHQPANFCARVLSIQVPKDYVVNVANGPNATYDIGTTNLNIKYTFELIDCIYGAYSS